MNQTIEQPDLCECGHEGYDGHDMRSVPPVCMTPGCDCGLGYQQLVALDTAHEAVPALVADEASIWTVAALTARMKRDLQEAVLDGDVPATVESLSAVHDHIDGNVLGTFNFGTDEGAPALPTMSWEVDWPADLIAAIDATVDRFNTAADAVDRWIKDGGLLDAVGAVVVYARLTFLPDATMRKAGQTLDALEVEEALRARLDEVYAGPDDWPITPAVDIIDGPLS